MKIGQSFYKDNLENIIVILRDFRENSQKSPWQIQNS